MQLRYNYRVYPGPGHRQAFARAFGCVQVVFNDGLAARQDARAAGQPYITDGELSARLTAAKATPGLATFPVSAIQARATIRSGTPNWIMGRRNKKTAHFVHHTWPFGWPMRRAIK